MRNFKKLVSVLSILLFFACTINAQDEVNKKGDVYYIVNEMPKYPGGEEALRTDIAQTVKYPEVAKEKGIAGKVYITFIVNEEGKITNSKIARGVDPSLDKEALRVLNSLDKVWTPGKEKGEAVKVSYTVPINFALDSESSEESKNSCQSSKNGDIFFIVEQMPLFPGGDEALRMFLADHLKYPEVAKKNGIQGKVYVTFVVDVDGSVTDTKIARGVDPALDKEALRVVNLLPNWTPGKQKGEAVKVSYTVPINFEFGDDKK